MRINVKNIEKIEEELTKVQKRARTNIITTHNIVEAATELEQKARNKMKISGMKGLAFTVSWTGGYDFFYGAINTTLFTLERGASHWFVIEIKRGYTQPHTFIPIFDINDKMKSAVLDHFISTGNW